MSRESTSVMENALTWLESTMKTFDQVGSSNHECPAGEAGTVRREGAPLPTVNLGKYGFQVNSVEKLK